MGWMTRGSRRYYYTSERVNGRPVRRYLGSGPDAQEAEAALEGRRRERAEQAGRLLGDADAHATAITPLLELVTLTDLLLKAALAAAGYHRHDRGAWRRKRHGKDQDHD